MRSPWTGRVAAAAGNDHGSGMLAWFILLLGAVLRLRPYLANRSLWIDEAWVALNVLDRGFAQLLDPLDYGQVAPLGFLFLEKLASRAFGTGEQALRLVPLLSGIAALFLFRVVAERVLSRGAALVVTALFALNGELIVFSSQVKPYSGDVLMTLSVLYCALSVSTDPVSRFRWLSLVGVLSAAPWFSFPAVFATGGVLAVLIASAAMRKDARRRLPVLGGVGLVCSLSVAVLWLTFIRPNLPGASNGWSETYPPAAGDPLRLLQWLFSKSLEVLQTPVGFGVEAVGLVACAFLIATATALRERGRHLETLSLLLSPVALLLLAAELHKYPFWGRFILFVVPLLLLIVGLGFVRFNGAVRGWIIPALGLLLIFLSPLKFAATLLARPDRVIRSEWREQLLPVMRTLEATRQPEEKLYVYRYAEAAFRYYLSRGSDEFPRLRQTADPASRSRIPGGIDPSGDYRWDRFAREVRNLCGSRVWILASHLQPEEQRILRGLLDGQGRRRKTISAAGAVAHLYDLRCGEAAVR